jgi:hypothetical protein
MTRVLYKEKKPQNQPFPGRLENSQSKAAQASSGFWPRWPWLRGGAKTLVFKTASRI